MLVSLVIVQRMQSRLGQRQSGDPDDIRVRTVLSSVVPCCPSKLEGRERTSGDDPVLAVPQPNTPSRTENVTLLKIK